MEVEILRRFHGPLLLFRSHPDCPNKPE
jgi:hypothetical protein